MLLHQNRFVDDVYERLREMQRGVEDVEVLLFVSMDCDALCACQILTALFKTDHVRFAIHPVAGYRDLQERFRELLSGRDEPSCVFLVNCGAMVNLEQWLSLGEYPGLVMCVADSHRPVDLSNLDADEDSNYKLYVMDSDDPDEAPPPDLSILEDMSDNSDSSDDSDSDTEDDDDDRSSDDEQARRQRRRTSESGDSEEVDPYDEEAYQAQRRRRHRRHKRQRKELQRQVNSYYSVTHFGATASSYMWELAAQLGHKSNELLWLNIVALTDYYVHERYTGNKYQEKVEALQNEVGRLNITQEDMLDDTVPEQDRIAFSEEFRFMLPRFWTLYDAMVHSSYVASRLEIWSEKGERKLDVLLAMMGIPKHVAKQKFSHMPSDYKKLLNARIAEYADKFGLTEVTYGSFQKFDGYRYRVSAADVVYSANALLEAGGEGPEKEMSAGDITLANFWNAYQALAGSASLSGQFVDKLQAGINRAIKLQQLVLMQGKIIIDKNHVSDCGRNFQWITVAETVDQEVFSQPLGLSKLALFLSAALRAKKKKSSRSRARPLVVATLTPSREMYLVVGVIGAPRVGEAQLTHNRFGQLFRKAANETQAQVKLDGFDMSVVEIRRDDLRKVYDYLSMERVE